MSGFSGVGVALVTPFHKNGDLDLPSLENLVHHVIKGGVDFLVILGTTGESATLSSLEKQQVIETIIETNADRVPNVIGCGGNWTAKVVQDLKSLEERYAPSGFLSVCPYYNKPSQSGLYQHFKQVAEAVKTDTILYNVPGRTSCNMLPETTLQLARDFANLSSIKDASGDLDHGLDLVKGKPKGFNVLSGEDGLIVPQIALGFDGIISVAANAVPGRFCKMVKTALAGDFSTAQVLNLELTDLMRLFFAEGNPAGVKSGLESLGIGECHVRLPLVPASEDLRLEIQEELIAGNDLNPS